MLEAATIYVVALASQMTIMATAVQSIGYSFTIMVASVGAASLSLSGALAWLATVLPIPKKDGPYKIVYKFVNVFGGNVGNAANAINKIVGTANNAVDDIVGSATDAVDKIVGDNNG